MPKPTLTPEAEKVVDEFLESRKWTEASVKPDPSAESQGRHQARLARQRVRSARDYKIRKAKKDEDKRLALIQKMDSKPSQLAR
jgi:hypothetical protein